MGGGFPKILRVLPHGIKQEKFQGVLGRKGKKVGRGTLSLYQSHPEDSNNRIKQAPVRHTCNSTHRVGKRKGSSSFEDSRREYMGGWVF